MVTVAGLTGLSRIFGFVRDILTAAILGAGPVADAFFVALKLPNFFRRVTAEGAFSVSFVPLYAGKLAQGKNADAFASNTFAVMLVILVPFTLLALVAMPWIIYAIAPGFAGDAVRYPLAVELSRVTFPYLLLMSLTALLGGVLNARERFAPFAFAPSLFNLCLIAALLFVTPVMETPGHAMAWGVVAAGIAQFAWLLFSARRAGVRLHLARPCFDTDMKRLFRLMGPGVIGAGVMHINLFADLVIASLLSSGSISYLYYADRLNQLPLGIVGIAVGTALLPMLSKAMANGETARSRNLFNRALEVCLLLALPAAAALFTVPDIIITVLFERGAFTAENTAITAQVLMGYTVGLPAYVASKVLSTAYWARQDTATPVKISIISTVINIALSLILIRWLGAAGIALATGITGWLQFIFLRRGLREHPAAQLDSRFKSVWPKIILSAAVMGAGLYAAAQAMEGWLAGPEYVRIAVLAALVTGGMAVYAAGILLSGAVKLADVRKYLCRK